MKRICTAKRTTAVRQLGTLLAVVCLVACGGGHGGPQSNSKASPTGSATYGITAHVVVEGHPEQSGWQHVAPVDWQAWKTAADVQAQLAQPPHTKTTAPGPNSQALVAPPRHIEATVEHGDAGTPEDTAATDKDRGYADGWSLLYWATTACLQPAGQSLGTADPSVLQRGLWVNTSPWRKKGVEELGEIQLFDAYYIFGLAPVREDNWSCDAQLLMQETLLCAADHLAQLGDSPGTVTWSGSDDNPSSLSQTITVTIPPQRSDDIFIARDMAVNALAHLVRLDTKNRQFTRETHGPAGAIGFESTCTEQYAGLDSNDVDNVVNVDTGSTYFDLDTNHLLLSTSSSSEFQAAGARRLARKAKVLAGAARLLKDLIERSVQADISGAQQRLSAESDAHTGAKLAWGADPTAPPYNTLRHALRTLFGRLEIGNNADPYEHSDDTYSGSGTDFIIDWVPHDTTRDDPQCSPYGSDITNALGAGVKAIDAPFWLPQLSARWDDVQAQTHGQVTALSMLDHAGIVLPAALVSAADPTVVRAAVTSVLVDSAAAAVSTPTAPVTTADFLATDSGHALTTILRTTSDQDIAFALQRVYDAFRLLTESLDETVTDAAEAHLDLNGQATGAGLTVVENAAITALGGVVIQGGLPRDELNVDPLASLSSLQHLSSCGTYSQKGVTQGKLAATDLEDALGPNAGDVTVFQNPFLLAEGFRRQLAAVAGAASSVDSGISDFAGLAAAEIREWAGPGTLLTEDPVDNPEGQQNLYLVNMSAQDVGADSNLELKDRLLLVSSSLDDSSTIANCLAGLRKHCPPIPDPTTPGAAAADSPFRKPSAGPTFVTLGSRLSVGLDHQTIKFVFPYRASGYTPGSYVVVRPQDGKPGQVLGWLRTPDSRVDSGEFYAEAYSRKQRSLAAQVFGIAGSTEPARTCLNVAPLSLPSEYCIEGMKKDEFVPLANELNSTGTSTSLDDSWKNYLEVARAAATKADQLGEQMIQNGLEQDLRKESAAEDLGNLCGSFISVDGTSESGGDVTVPSGDSQLTQCVNPTTVDLLFLRGDPIPTATTSDQIRKAMCTGYPADHYPATDPPFCSRTDEVTHQGLGLHSGTTTPVDTDISKACADVTSSLSASTLQTPYFGKAVAEPWSTAAGIGEALSSLRLIERADGEWGLWLGAQRVLTGSDGYVTANVPAPAAGADDKRADVWPYCTVSANHTLAVVDPDATPPKTASCSLLASFVGKMFPSISPSEGSPLRPTLRDEVERTVFYMGALAGGIPAGTIQMPLPVANLGTAVVAAPALYSPGNLVDSGLRESPTDQTTIDPKHLKPLYSLTSKGYRGAARWNASDPSDLGFAKAFSSSSTASATYISTRTGASEPAWRRAVYQQAGQNIVNNGYLYVDTTNAAITFDQALVAGADATKPGRADLPSWLNARGYDYTQVDPNFISNIEQATFFTTPVGDATADPKSIVPYKFCNSAKLATGRSVCAGALASPVFYESRGYTNDGSTFVPETCDLGQKIPEDLFVTDIASSRMECTLHYQHLDEQPGYRCTPGTAHYVINANGATVTDGILGQNDLGGGWFSASLAAGSKEGWKGFVWGLSPNVDPASALLPSWEVNLAFTSDNNWQDSGGWGVLTSRSIWQDRLKPSVCSPGERLELFMNNRLTDRLSAMQTLVRILGLSCVNSNQHVGVSLGDLPPPINTVGDIDTLAAWEKLLGYNIDKVADQLFLVDVPTDVVNAAQSGKALTGAVSGGVRGAMVLDLASKLSLLENGFADVGSNMQQISDAINKAKLDIQAAELNATDKRLTVAAATIDNDRQRDLATVSIAAGVCNLAAAAASAFSIKGFVSSGGDTAHEIINSAAQIASGGIDRAASSKMDDVLSQQTQAAGADQRNGEAQAVLALSTATNSLYTAVNDGLTGIKTNINDALADVDKLKTNGNDALVDLAKAQGADFMQLGSETVPLNVNTVYRRQFDITKQRYELAIKNAKQTAYLARLSIEQRLGVRLDELHENVGPLPAPATWVDDLCTVQGVNYDALRTATQGQTPTSAGEIDTIKGFANQFIGDYIDKLEEFVQFYNVQNPFADSGDVAVVSLREDLPSSLSRCVAPAKNLLFHSDELSATSPDSSSVDMVSHGGWRITGCDSEACLTVNSGGALVNGTGTAAQTVQPPGGLGRASFLSTVSIADTVTVLGPQGAAGDSNGDGGSVVPPAAPPSPAPSNALFQTVTLHANVQYVLSWWDMARSADGIGPASVTPGRYVAAVFDQNWTRLAGDSFVPWNSSDGGTWSDRRSLDVVPAADGEYHVLFTAGPADTVGSGLAIADVQLEAASGDVASASAYQSNEGSLMHLTAECSADTPDQFRARFDRECDSLGCYFQLRDLLNIDTQVLNEGSSSLIGKLAPGNYNYRNNTLALNVVGTGVIDCSRATGSSCNGSAYVQYDLDHVAYNVPIEDYQGASHCFDFGQGSIRGGKALASERFITLPMGSADRDMINQSPFLKPEFSGRPLSGSYRLRIHDEPQLVWKNVQDVQMVMNYGYWSRVARSPGN